MPHGGCKLPVGKRLSEADYGGHGQRAFGEGTTLKLKCDKGVGFNVDPVASLGPP